MDNQMSEVNTGPFTLVGHAFTFSLAVLMYLNIHMIYQKIKLASSSVIHYLNYTARLRNSD